MAKSNVRKEITSEIRNDKSFEKLVKKRFVAVVVMVPTEKRTTFVHFRYL